MKKWICRILFISGVAAMISGSAYLIKEDALSVFSKIPKEIWVALIAAIGGIITAVISGVYGLRISRYSEKCEMDREKLRLSHEKEMLARRKQDEQAAILADGYGKMLAAVSDYSQKHDMNYKTAALNAVTTLAANETGEQKMRLLGLRLLIQDSDAFEGPPARELSGMLDDIISNQQKQAK